MDILLDNKATKQKLLESKEDYGKILKEQLQQKEKWDKDKENYELTIEKQREEFKKTMDKHQEDVKKALKIHKANEKLAKQNLQLKNEIKALRESNPNVFGSINEEQEFVRTNKSVSFQNQPSEANAESSPDRRGNDKGCANWICVKNLTEKQRLETEVQALKEEIESLESQLKEQKTLPKLKNSEFDKDNEKEKLIEQLQEVNTKMIELSTEVAEKELEIEKLQTAVDKLKERENSLK